MTLLFCGITLKHYAYYNMSRRTQLTTKYVFQTLAQLSENFIFIYLGITLFTETKLVFKPLFILVTVFGICVARWAAVFPLSKLINWVIRVRARRSGGGEVADELPHSYQVMLFWAGLRGAVGVALRSWSERKAGERECAASDRARGSGAYCGHLRRDHRPDAGDYGHQDGRCGGD